jgi:16S rRNA (uracil1498-N3)-methyltransferase
MRTPRVQLPDGISAADHPGALVDLPPAEAHHVARVLRRRAGDPVIVLGAGGEALDAVIDEIMETGPGPGDGARVRIRILGRAAVAAARTLPWTIGLAVVKADAFDLAVRMAAELSLGAIAPLWTERTVVRPESGARDPRRLARWERIAREAAKQCGRAQPLRIEEPRTLQAFVDECRAARRWIAVPGGPFRRAALGGEASVAAETAFLVGPEGGFTPAEVDRARAAGFSPVGLPVPVLRAPTAVALLAALGLLEEAFFA